MVWFRRRPLHEQLARAADGALDWRSEYEPIGPATEAGITGIPRRREWDAIVVADAPGMRDEPIRFVALPDGTLLLEEGDEPGDLTPLAEAVETQVPRPYRAEAVRKSGDRFAIGARRIAVAELPDSVEGNEVTLTVRDGERHLDVDGAPAFGSIRELERLGEAIAPSYVVSAERLDGSLFEVRVSPL